LPPQREGETDLEFLLRMSIELVELGRQNMGEGEKFEIKAGGERKTFDSGMQRDVDTSKIMWDLVWDGPMLERYARHLTGGAVKYSRKNWMRASTVEELERFRESAARHFAQWLMGDRSEDHAAAVIFNLNGAEYVRDRLNSQ
jgi:hypothetical protein